MLCLIGCSDAAFEWKQRQRIIRLSPEGRQKEKEKYCNYKWLHTPKDDKLSLEAGMKGAVFLYIVNPHKKSWQD